MQEDRAIDYHRVLLKKTEGTRPKNLARQDSPVAVGFSSYGTKVGRTECMENCRRKFA